MAQAIHQPNHLEGCFFQNHSLIAPSNDIYSVDSISFRKLGPQKIQRFPNIGL